MAFRSNRKSKGAQIEQVMNQPVFCCGVGDSLNVAAQLMWEHDCGVVPVVDDDGRLSGIVTDRDLCMAAYTQGAALAQIPVTSAMTPQVHVCTPQDTLEAAEGLMRDKQVRRLPVVDAEMRPLGMVSLSDIARFGGAGSKRGKLEHELTETFSAICTPRHEALTPSPEPSEVQRAQA